MDLQLSPDAKCLSATSHMYVLDNDVPEDPGMFDVIQQYNSELSRLNRHGGLEALGLQIRPAPAGTGRFVGSESCRECHQIIYDNWKKSKHANAFATLVRRQRDNNPGCLECHVVGLASEDGFNGIAATPERVNVQCESCHGRASRHVQARRADKSKTTGQMPPVQSQSCTVCHDCIHSVKFDYSDYWKKLNHGQISR